MEEQEIKTSIQDLKSHSTKLNESFLDSLFIYFKTNFLFTKITNSKEIVTPIVNKLDSLKPHSPEKTTTPIVAGLKAVQSAIEGKTETDIRPQLELLGKILKDEIGKLDREVVVKNDLSQLLGLFKSNGDKKDVVNALKSIEKLIPKIQEVPDYTLLLSGVIDAVENIKLEIPQAKEAEKIGHYLQQIIDKAYPEFPELQFNKEGRLKVEVDRTGGGYGGLSSQDSNNLQSVADNGATESKQDSIIENLQAISTNLPNSPETGLATEETLQAQLQTSSEEAILLRRMVKIMESLGTVDLSKRQRIAVETIAGSSLGVGIGGLSSGAGVPGPNAATGNAPQINAGTTYWQQVWIGPVDQRYVLKDQARNTYNNSIRNHITFN